METEPLRIDLFADVVCPWCFVGHERLERVLASSGRSARITHHPFMLDPHTPPEGDDIPARLRRKYGVAPEQLWARLEAEARKSGLELDLAKQRLSYPTARAHTLMRHTEVAHQHAFAKDLFEAYFLEARDISTLDVLVEIAEPHGHTAENVRRLVESTEELAATKREALLAPGMGIHGAPFFILDSSIAISGAQPEDVFRRALQKLATADAS